MPKRSPPDAGEVLGRRVLNRALLARQGLLRRWTVPPAEAVERLVGMQAQAPDPPYVGLWTRLEGFRPEELSRLVEQRAVVRIALMRSTIHLVTARDGLALRPLLQPVLDRAFRGAYGRRLEGMDTAALADAARALVQEKPRTYADVGAALGERWPDRDPAALSAAARTLLPLVQVPPRGLWGRSGPAAHTTAEAWLGRRLDTDYPVDDVVLRYLAAFGPATVADVQTWSGLTRLKDVVERLRPGLLAFRDEQGRELFDFPDAPRPHPETPAPARFMAEWDNVLLSHADRTRVISEDHRRRIFTPNGIFPGTILVDGFVAGTWKIERHRGAATLRVEPFAPVAAGDQAALSEEGERLLDFAAAEIPTREVRFAAPG
ncbi:MAG TPA: winged helix DNA-binding domain-containing protein [Longimicrobiaceae bacterium]|nr:winged helix DNA-binding domain-containing protein [Longimicrobiaceae bacterium]